MTSTITNIKESKGWDFAPTTRLAINRKSSTHTHKVEMWAMSDSMVGSYKLTNTSNIGTGFTYTWSDDDIKLGGRFFIKYDGKLRVKLTTYNGSKEIGTITYNYPVTTPIRATIQAGGATMGTYEVGKDYTVEFDNGSFLWSFFNIPHLSEANRKYFISDSKKHGEKLNFNIPYSNVAELFDSRKKSVTLPANVFTMVSNVNMEDMAYMLRQSGVSKEITLVAPKVPPLFDGVVYFKNTDQKSADFLGTDGTIAQNLSNLVLYITEHAVPQYGTTLEKYIVEIGNIKKEFPPTTTSFDMGKISVAGNQTIRFTALDSRGNANIKQIQFNVVPYNVPTIQATSVTRGSGTDSTIKVSFSGTYSPLVSVGVARNNIASTHYRIKKTTDPAYPDYVEMPRTTVATKYNTDVLTILNTDPYSTYTIEFRVVDKYGNVTVKESKIASSLPILFVDSEKSSVGVNCFPSREGSLEVDGNAYVSGDLTIEHSKSLVLKGDSPNKYRGNLDYNTDLNSFIFSTKSGTNTKTEIQKLLLQDGKGVNHSVWDSRGLRIERGSVVITPVAGKATGVTVAYKETYPAPPMVLTSCTTTVIGTTVLGHTAANITNSTADIYVTRTNTTNTTVQYFIIYWEGM